MFLILTGKRPDHDRRSCADCGHLVAYVSWWCSNKKACEWRGSNIPGGIKCPFWVAAVYWPDLSWWEKLKMVLFYDYVKCGD